MNYNNKFSKTSMYIFTSPKISKSIFVEEQGDLSLSADVFRHWVRVASTQFCFIKQCFLLLFIGEERLLTIPERKWLKRFRNEVNSPGNAHTLRELKFCTFLPT